MIKFSGHWSFLVPELLFGSIDLVVCMRSGERKNGLHGARRSSVLFALLLCTTPCLQPKRFVLVLDHEDAMKSRSHVFENEGSCFG